MSCKAKQWKRNNTCKAQVILEKMFDDEKIPEDASASAIHALDPEFLKYSLPVFRGAFNAVRAKLGVSCKFVFTMKHFVFLIYKLFLIISEKV